MFDFYYPYSDHLTYLQTLAQALNVPVENNTILLPSSFGSGYVRAIELANGLQILVNEVVIYDTVKIIRNTTALQNGYTLRFDEVINVAGLTVEMENEIFEENNLAYSGVTLTNSLTSFTYTAPAGTQNRCVNIYFTEEWLNKNFGITNTDEAMVKYLSLKTAILNFEVLNLEYRQLMEEIFFVKTEQPMQKVILQNRVMLLMEKFFKSIYKRINDIEKNIIVSVDTVKRMMQLESLLVKDLSVLPPTIPLLAKQALMSETKLKIVFKQVYGYNIYEYYQKSRMLKARQLLKAQGLSIKEIGQMLGFQNLSNFSIAYKKEFNMLPRDV